MASEWQLIGTAPSSKLLLVGDFKERDVSEHYVGVAMFEGGRWRDGFSPDWTWNGSFRPTHWMHLPDPPPAS